METIKAHQSSTRLSIASTFTSDPIKDAFKLWGETFGFYTSVHFSPYDQVFQQLLNPNSALNHPENDARIVFVKLDDWTRNLTNPDESAVHDHISSNVQLFCKYVTSAASLVKSPLIVTITRNSEESGIKPQQQTEYERLIKDELSKQTNVVVITTEETDRLYPVVDYFDAEKDRLGHIPYRAEYFTALATSVFRKILAGTRKPYKVIVLDCDNTLWGGVCGEVGPRGIILSKPYRKLQAFMQEQVRSGKILCLCSKNVEQDVIRVFTERPDMVIKYNDIVSSKINWHSKSQNLRELSEELNLGLDSFIFVDDNPVECAEVRANCPEVLTFNLPANPDEITRFLDHAWPFDYLRSTREDQQRTRLYKDNIKRSGYQNASSSLKEFIDGLNLEIRISEAGTDEISRVSQLTYRTNQFNFTTIRRSEDEIKEMIGADCLSCKTCSVKDRFGDYGLVGVMMYYKLTHRLVLESFMLSCRVLGRGVEHKMLRTLGETAKAAGLGTVQLNFQPSGKNLPAANFLKSVFKDFASDASLPENGYTTSADFLTHVKYAPERVEQIEVKTNGKAPKISTSAKVDKNSLIFEQIARDLNSAAKISQLIPSNGKASASDSVASASEGESDPMRIITKIWEDVLGKPNIGPDQHFFDVGGTSLKAVEVLSQLNELFNKNLTIVSLFEYSTIQLLAHLVEDAPVQNVQFSKVLEKAASRRTHLKRRV